MKELAASEVIGALMIISLIVSLAGFLYLMSYPIIVENEETIKYRKAYFDILEIREKIENVRSGLEFDASYTLRISDTSFTFENEPVIFLNGIQYNVSSIKVSSKGWEIFYENGAIIEKRALYSKILHYPDIYYDTETGTVTLPIIMFIGTQSVGGSGYLTLALRIKNTEKVSLNNCTIKVISKNAKSWENFLESLGIPNLTRSGNEVTFFAKKVETTFYEVEVR